MKMFLFFLLNTVTLAVVAKEFDTALMVKTTPVEMELYINGELRASSPLALSGLASGTHGQRVAHELLVAETDAVVLATNSTVIGNEEPSGIREFRDTLADGSPGPIMVLIPAGSFIMGSPENESDRLAGERQHEVMIQEPFALGRFEVTFDEYDRFAKATGRDKPDDVGWGRGSRPVINVSWHDAVAYADWLSEQTGETYRLPTDVEWEYAARAGTTTVYWWGDEVGDNLANCDGCGSQWDNEKTAPVGSFEANPWGLYDTAGNIQEWTCSAMEGDYKGAGHCIEKNHAGRLAIRGGAWFYYPSAMRAASRSWSAADWRFSYIGFRLARAYSSDS